MKPDDGLGGWAEYEDLENDDMSLIPWDAFRSADMSQLSISFPDDGDLPHAVIKALAETKNCQFEDVRRAHGTECEQLRGRCSASSPRMARNRRYHSPNAASVARCRRLRTVRCLGGGLTSRSNRRAGSPDPEGRDQYDVGAWHHR